MKAFVSTKPISNKPRHKSWLNPMCKLVVRSSEEAFRKGHNNNCAHTVLHRKEHRLHTDTIIVTFKKRSKQYFNSPRRGRKKMFYKSCESNVLEATGI